MAFESFPVWVNLSVIAVAAVVVWFSGTRLSLIADAISERTGLGHAFVGALFLGGATSLPEIATTLTASALGNAPMAISNLLGGIAMQIAVLALIDLALVKGALTYFAPYPILLLSGALLILQTSLAIMAVSVGDVQVFWGIGVWPLILTISYLVILQALRSFEGSKRWVPADIPDEIHELEKKAESRYLEGDKQSKLWVFTLFGLNCVLILAGGWTIASAADSFAQQTGLASGFLGATLVALTTSLPEISTTAGAVRVGAYSMAIANIFGTNTLELVFLLPADFLYPQDAIINAVDDSAVLLAALANCLTVCYLWGILERRNRVVCGMGIDSLLVLLSYSVGLVLLYQLS